MPDFLVHRGQVVPARSVAPGDALASHLLALTVLNGLTVTSVELQSNGDLRFDFSDSASVVIDGEPALDTTVEPWWIAAG